MDDRERAELLLKHAGMPFSRDGKRVYCKDNGALWVRGYTSSKPKVSLSVFRFGNQEALDKAVKTLYGDVPLGCTREFCQNGLMLLVAETYGGGEDTKGAVDRFLSAFAGEE